MSAVPTVEDFTKVSVKLQTTPGVLEDFEFLGARVHRFEVGNVAVDYFVTPCDQVAVVVEDVLLFCTEDANELTGCSCREVSEALGRVPARSWLDS